MNALDDNEVNSLWWHRAFVVWEEGLREAYDLARGTRLSELRGERVKTFDAAGTHPYSQAWGRVLAAERLVSDLAVVRVGGETEPCTPVTLRRVAMKDAAEAFVHEVQSKGTEAFA